MRVEFDNDGIRKMVDQAAQASASRLQRLYDQVLDAGQGKTEADVKQLLAREWRATFGTEITDPELSRAAAVLASGRRIRVKPHVKG